MTEIISTFFASLGDIEKAKSLITPDAVFIAAREKQYPALPLYGSFVGPSGLEQFVAGLRATYDTQLFAVDGIVETPVQGAAFGRLDHLVVATGRRFKSQWAVHCRFEDGLISYYRFYEDTAALEDAMEARTFCLEEME